jgi:mannose-6-phosphate isomerase
VLYPLTFQPLFKERVWGGRNLERLYAKPLPPGVSIGESWEIADRPGAVSIITNGPLAGRDLRWLMEQHTADLLGSALALNGRFPLLLKILDARETLSLQVHPPAALAARMGGEPKTELWHITSAEPKAKLFAGLKRGVTRPEFERRIRDGSVAESVHCLPVRAGDTLFLPSGRVHALGAGLVLFEIQQNSDTTYRVFDWNRPGLDGKPRELHVAQALASIDFGDFEPALLQAGFIGNATMKCRVLVNDPLFRVDEWQLAAGDRTALDSGAAQIIVCLSGRIHVSDSQVPVQLSAGAVCLVPACRRGVEMAGESEAHFLRIEPGN